MSGWEWRYGADLGMLEQARALPTETKSTAGLPAGSQENWEGKKS